jgi:8-oxo-dGTP pyrophosphatase MutT (NUDIX family)
MRLDAAIVGLRDERRQILMVRTKRHPGHWQAIGGCMEPQETPTQTALRELNEELGLVFSTDRLRPIVQTPIDFDEGTIHFFEADYDPKDNAPVFDEIEILEHRWLNLGDARELPVLTATNKFLTELS